MGHGRHRSPSSSSSSDSSSGSDEEKKSKKAQKKAKKAKEKDPSHFPSPSGHAVPSMPSMPSMPMAPMPVMPKPDGNMPTPTFGGHPVSSGHNTPASSANVPEAGHRHPYTAERSNGGPKRDFVEGYKTRIDMNTAGTPPTYDMDGHTPVFVGSVILDNGRAVHPCKIVPTFECPALYAYGGAEVEHLGRFDLLPVDLSTMEWVAASGGQNPPGRRLVQGGYEEGGERLYHALAIVEGVRVPGKTGPHLGAANVSFGSREHRANNYHVLCWRN